MNKKEISIGLQSFEIALDCMKFIKKYLFSHMTIPIENKEFLEKTLDEAIREIEEFIGFLVETKNLFIKEFKRRENEKRNK